MAFKTNYMTKYDQLDRFTKQQQDPTTTPAGAASRQRTKRMVALGQSQAEETKVAMQSSAQGVKRIFNQSDIGSSRERGLGPDFDAASWIQGIEEDYQENKRDEEYNALKISEDLYGKKGVQAGSVASQSYFDSPIIEGELRGRSRRAGDASPEVQQTIMNKIIEVGSRLDMSDYEIAYTLATVRYESGFNPDAAAKSSSARGLGQLINRTGKAYGINVENQWDVDMQVQAVLEHTSDNFRMAAKKGYSNDYVYALHHDGPALDSGGLGIGKENVMPFVPKYLELVKSFRGEE